MCSECTSFTEWPSRSTRQDFWHGAAKFGGLSTHSFAALRFAAVVQESDAMEIKKVWKPSLGCADARAHRLAMIPTKKSPLLCNSVSAAI